MERRELIKLLAAGTALPAQRGRRRRAAPRDPDTCRFELDGANRWSLARGGETIVSHAEISLEMDREPPIPLSALTGVRRYRTRSRNRDAWNVIGLAGTLEVSVEFADGDIPVINVRVRGLDLPRTLLAMHFTGGHTVPHANAWINGYQSWSGCSAISLGAETAATGYWQLALLGGPGDRGTGKTGLALSFDADDGGAGEFRLAGRRLDALSRFGRRTLSLDHSPAMATLALQPSGDPLLTLGDLAGSGLPRPPDEVPAGWCSWYELYANVTEADIVANVEAARASFDPRYFRFIQVDDGFQRAAGDWETNDKFPRGHRWLTERIRSAGFKPGLWIAPFAVTERSGIPSSHPEWLLLGDDDLPLKTDVQPHWGGQSFALDASQRAVQDWLRELARNAVTAWGYDYLKLDFLHYGALGRRPGRATGPHESLRAGLKALRQGAGKAYLLGCGAPLQHALGQFDGMRIGGDVEAAWDGIAPGARAAAMRAHYQGRAWHNDPDALVVREPLTLDEARAWTSIVALSGGVTMASDYLPRLGIDRLELLQRTMPVARIASRPLDLLGTETPSAPALFDGTRAIVTLPKRWRFKAGDSPAYASGDFDDASWEEIDVGINWERAGHEGLDGFAWYRARFTAPRRPATATVALELGRIDDADETWLNGTKIGATGTMPPDYHEAWQTWRRYAVTDEAMHWGAENVVAVRVYDGGGGGGMWSVAKDRPPAQLLGRTAEDRWMLAITNWDDEPKTSTIDLASHGVAGSFATYDVWDETRLADIQGRLTLVVPPHSAKVIGLARARSQPFVLGSTRHVVQGVVDIAEQRWDARERRLSGKSVRLDGRPYALTIAVPSGLRAESCRGNGACVIGRQTRNSVRVEFAPTRDDLEWEISF